MQNKNGLPIKKINLLLPFYLEKGFGEIFESSGFNIIWAETQEELETLIESTRIDIAIEWQHGERDFIIRDLLRQYKKDAKIFLALNWNGKIPSDFDKLGYVDVINVPFNLNDLKLKIFNPLGGSMNLSSNDLSNSPFTLLSGIDLAWKTEEKTSAMVFGRLQEGVLKVTELVPAVKGVEKILSRIASQEELSGIAIDAPLIIENESSMRDCEREIGKSYGRKGAAAFPTNLTLYPDPPSVMLSKQLGENGYNHLAHGSKWQIECYPHPAIIEMFGLEYRLAYKKPQVTDQKYGQIALAEYIQSLKKSDVLKLQIPERYQQHLNSTHIDSLKGPEIKKMKIVLMQSFACILLVYSLFLLKAKYMVTSNMAIFMCLKRDVCNTQHRFK